MSFCHLHATQIFPLSEALAAPPAPPGRPALPAALLLSCPVLAAFPVEIVTWKSLPSTLVPLAASGQSLGAQAMRETRESVLRFLSSTQGPEKMNTSGAEAGKCRRPHFTTGFVAFHQRYWHRGGDYVGKREALSSLFRKFIGSIRVKKRLFYGI